MSQKSTGSGQAGPKLTLQLTDDQLAALKPIMEATNKIQIAGSIEGNQLSVSFVACNAAFLACNAAFLACNAAFSVQPIKRLGP
jgi:hypothetical protein